MQKVKTGLEVYSSLPSPLVLSISLDERDYHVLREMIDPAWTLVQVSTLRAAFNAIRKGRPAAVLCDTDLPAGTWRDVLEHTSASPDAPRLIVTSRLADEALWAEALNLGAWDVLAKPFDAEEVGRILDMACRPRTGANQAAQVPVLPQSLPRKTVQSDEGVEEYSNVFGA